ncbi:hypothetical protein QF031_000072 [Pseudarthrobacter defluvii]|uniref:hypothetical protein n=1 Tax=Pseudarthrobacter defluvii TaxID=410837 RepID=UPI002784628F|nr:hypothetical protein [Pseudarthrobacter defluvii]MDQ0767323.1 hypothetical protein [Pseudarthrobacter defluvii]
MESASLLALLFAGPIRAGESAQPNAPQVITKSGWASVAWLAFRSRTATLLHRLAWALEPDLS